MKFQLQFEISNHNFNLQLKLNWASGKQLIGSIYITSFAMKCQLQIEISNCNLNLQLEFHWASGKHFRASGS